MTDQSDDAFYRRCAEILGTDYDCKPFAGHRRTRWNNRAPGSGRFPGHGLIRLFGDTVQIVLRHPVVMHRTIEGRQAAVDALKSAIVSSQPGPERSDRE